MPSLNWSNFRPPMPPGSKPYPTRFEAPRPLRRLRPSSMLITTRWPPSSRRVATVATDDTRFGRFARPLDGAGPGRRPQGLRCAHRQAPALALDPATQAQRVAVMPFHGGCVRRQGSVMSTGHAVTFLSGRNCDFSNGDRQLLRLSRTLPAMISCIRFTASPPQALLLRRRRRSMRRLRLTD
jgi:hypothetical protein